MKRSLVVMAALAALTGCNRRTSESGLKVLVNFEPHIQSVCVEVFARSGQLERSTGRVVLAGRPQLVVAVAQGDLPDEVTLEAVGYQGADCAEETRPPERALPVAATFQLNKITNASLRVVHTAKETSCADGLDDDGDGNLDCADDDCNGASCSTGNVCVTGQVCADHVCGNGSLVICNTPPSECFDSTGVCVQGEDGGCRYGIRSGGVTCDTRDLCTEDGRCSGTGQCIGRAVTCAQSANQCLATSGSCDRDAGCVFAPRTNQVCNDGDNCTLTDLCDNDGGCAGTRVSCPASECAAFTGQCDADGGCRYTSFDAGTPCDAGLCNGAGGCIPDFPYVPSNFTQTQVPTPPTQPVALNCGETVITTRPSGAPTVSNWCGQPAFGWADLAQDGGPAALLLSFSDLDVGADAGLRIVGERPVIIVATGDVRVFGWISAESGAQACTVAGAGGSGTSGSSVGGGGGGGFGSAGASGGDGAPIVVQGQGGSAGAVNGDAQLVPLRGGCPGGNGGEGSGAAGGGALQISAVQNVIVSGVGAVSAPGRGGGGGAVSLPSYGGKGGGSGGALLLEALQLQLVGNAAVTANGGAGGKGGGAVAAGEDGATGARSTAAPAEGGQGLGLGGNGGDGGTVTVAATPGAVGTSFIVAGGGGGGGGGFGRLRLSSVLTCSVGAGVVFSPAPVSAPDSGCP